MSIHYNIWLLILAAIAASSAIYISFWFVEKVHRSTVKVKSAMLFSLATGTGIWANHFLTFMSFHSNANPDASWAVLYAWLCAVIIGACFMSIAIIHNPKIQHFTIGGFICGICNAGLFYASYTAIYGAQVTDSNLTLPIAGTCISIIAITVILILYHWIKTYSGRNHTLLKIASAIGITLIIFSMHLVFYAAFSEQTTVHPFQSNPYLNLKIIAIAIASNLLSLLMMAFIFFTLYEKHGKSLFNFNAFNADTSDDLDETSLNDSLTKLPNRRSFESNLDSAEHRCIRSQKAFAVAYIDLDSFKPVNDNYGHHIGDAVLIIVAERLIDAIRGCDFVARVGGDEFIAIIEEINTEEDIRPVVERIVNSIREPYFVDHLNITLSCSVGIAIFPKDGRKNQLLVNADAAMYKAKDQGKNQYKFYDAEIESANVLIKSLQNDLHQALKNNEFSIAYLPKLDCKSLTAVGAEALIRWNHPTKGEILPNDFLSIAEQCGLIKEINDWVVSECCSTLVKARNADLELKISVNLSSYQYRDPDLVKNIVRTIEKYDLHPNHLSFEIKETAAINNQKQFTYLLAMFKDAGIKVILDDFGLQPVSLTYLLDLNVDEVKIDRSFIAMVNKDKGAKALIDAIFKLTHALGFKVTAEGIEDKAQQNTIIELGCDFMQGYLFSKPVKEDELLVLYKKLQFKQLQIDFDAP